MDYESYVDRASPISKSCLDSIQSTMGMQSRSRHGLVYTQEAPNSLQLQSAVRHLKGMEDDLQTTMQVPMATMSGSSRHEHLMGP